MRRSDTIDGKLQLVGCVAGQQNHYLLRLLSETRLPRRHEVQSSGLFSAALDQYRKQI